MAQEKTRAVSTGQPRTAASFVWDTEERHELLEKEGRVRGNTLYLTVALAQWMEAAFGGVLSYVKTSTDLATGEVTVAKALEGEPGAVTVQRAGTLNALKFNFWRPLRKLSLKVPPDRQFNVTPFTREIEGLGTVFIFPLNERESAPRNTRGEADEEAQADDVAAAQQQHSDGQDDGSR